ncbi:HAUS augmin-like complex subunit 7 isoform X1 [Takifugu rubripes]|uniref:HAUS augmin-like complex, subunit 7 n=1 Tax=Takifugu rubripes TaxID=31033 RepID=A0A674MTZ3_TAKRU|nr:HAUS augmin-like complex subunit 7 isoform X1 [Takifugu rubripes]
MRKMARASTEEELARDVFTSLQAVSCPLVEDVKLQDPGSILQLLCAPSQHRSDILAWICCRVDPNFCSCITKATLRSRDQEVLWKEVALLGQELMLCRAADQDLLREGRASVHQQLHFLQQLLTLLPGSKRWSGARTDTEMLLHELCTSEHVSQLLTPALEPWPSHTRTLAAATRASCKASREEAADVSSLLQLSSSALEQLQSECDFLREDAGAGQAVFSPGLLQVAAGDLWQLMAAFSRVYEADLRAYCCRDAPSFSTDPDVFQRTLRLLETLVTELEVLKEVPEAFVSMNQEVRSLQTQRRYPSGGQKLTFLERLEELIRRVRGVSGLRHPR